MANSCLRVKTNAEMLAEILPSLEEIVRRRGTIRHPEVRDELELAKSFGATVAQVASALRRGKGLE